MNDDVIKALLKSINSIHVNDSEINKKGLTKEREKQYDQVFDQYKDSLENVKKRSYSEMTNLTIDRYFNEIFDANPSIAEYKDRIKVVPVDSSKSITTAFELDGNSIIAYDNFTMTFLWVMNKAHYYGMHYGLDFQRELFYNIYLHYGSLANVKLFEGQVFERPKTPPHSSIEQVNMLGLSISIQEKFLMAHEIAHLIIADKNSESFDKAYLDPYYLKLIEPEDRPSIELELAADEIAFCLLTNSYDLSEKWMLEFFCNNIFLLVRYMLWSSVAFNINSNHTTDYNFELWLARNAQIRKLIDSYCMDKGGAMFIIECLEYLEESLEPAAMAAKDTLIKVHEHIKNADKRGEKE